MTTDKGMNYQSILWLVMSAITAMDSGTERTVLLSIGMVVMAIVAWRTTGSGLSPQQSEEILDTTESIEKVIQRGRDAA